VHARSTTIMADPGSIDSGVAFIRDEVMPTLEGMDGCIGLSLLVDRASGRCIATSAWRDENMMRASDGQLRSSRQRAAEIMGADRPQVEEWEIAVLHRDHPSERGACVRVAWVRADPQQLDHAIEYWKSTILPGSEGFDGFCSASLLVHRTSGRAAASVTFDSRDAMERSRERADAMREQSRGAAGIEVLEVGEFELALAHLRVPELV
jgi:hypothetical protein